MKNLSYIDINVFLLKIISGIIFWRAKSLYICDETRFKIITYFLRDGLNMSAHINHLIINARITIHATVISSSICHGKSKYLSMLYSKTSINPNVD